MHFHLLANSHLDPVWLWDWREGLNEGITTCRTVLQLLDEFPELTYLRGETSVYAHIAQHDPGTLERIRGMVAQGRWDIVGGTVCQPDTNLPATEVLCRHFTEGLDYLRRTFQARPTVAWAADSFGHSRGWPEIYAAAGMRSFAFSRPLEHDCPLPGPAFWWRSASGQRVLCWRAPIGWYGSGRGEVAARLDQFRSQADKWGLEHVAIFYGLGNHGGGPTRRQIREVLQWREAHRDIQVEFSTLHRFFAALRQESANLPVIEKELNFTLRGCYASAARFKFAYRKTENLLLGAERASSAVAAAFGAAAPRLHDAWESVLFNTFHDILPGSSIERAYDDQQAWLGVAYHQAQCAQLAALNTLAAHLDTRVPPPANDMPSAVPVLLWNPHPEPYAGYAEFEAALDYRPITAYRGKPEALPVAVRDHQGRSLPFQLVEVDSHFGTELPWRKRFVVPVALPPLGWRIIQVAWDENAKPAPALKQAARPQGRHAIRNESLVISARPGRSGIAVTLDGRPLFGRAGFQVCTFDDPYGSWGGHDGEREADDISTVLATWTVQRTAILETGPHRAALWVQLGAGQSRLDLTFYLERGARSVRIAARLVWNERNARLKLVMPGGDHAEYEVPGGTIQRGPLGEVPGGRWVRVARAKQPWIFASDALYNFDAKKGALRATVVRSTRYAWNAPSRPDTEPWRPHLDLGEHKFQFALGAGELDPWQLAAFLEQPPQALLTHPHKGSAKPAGSFLRLPVGTRLLALKPAADGPGWILRLQVTAQRPVAIRLVWLGQPLALGRLVSGRIASWCLQKGPAGWKADSVNVAEEKATEPAGPRPSVAAVRRTRRLAAPPAAKAAARFQAVSI